MIKLYTPVQLMCSGKLHKHPALPVSPVMMQIEKVQPPQTHVINLYTPCYLCEDVVRVGSMRFDVLEPPQTSA